MNHIGYHTEVYHIKVAIIDNPNKFKIPFKIMLLIMNLRNYFGYIAYILKEIKNLVFMVENKEKLRISCNYFLESIIIRLRIIFFSLIIMIKKFK